MRPPDSAPEDTRPRSVQQLDRTCTQLSLMLSEQERALKVLESALGSAVSKAHVDLLFQGRLTHSALGESVAALTSEMERLLGTKADTAAVEAALGGKASVATLESLRAEALALRDSLKAGDGVEGRLLQEGDAQAQASPFQQYQLEIGSLVKQLREEEAAARAQEAALIEERRKRQMLSLQQRTAAGSALLASGADGADDAEGGMSVRILNADGTPFTPSSAAGDGHGSGGAGSSGAGGPVSAEQAARDQAERADLRDRLARMEMAIQLANVGGSGSGGGGGSGGAMGAGGLTLDADGRPINSAAELQLARLEKLMDNKYARTERLVDELRTKCAQSEKDVERLVRALEQRSRAQALPPRPPRGTCSRTS